jgi:predicted ATPase
LGLKDISQASIANAIGGQKILIVVDNCEHVVDAAAGLIEVILRACPRAVVLATSREMLRIAGEQVWHVRPLDVPLQDERAPDVLLGHSAVALFVARASEAASERLMWEGNLPTIAAICRRLDGIPLAIEFAASRAATLGLDHVALRLDDRFALLATGRRTALPRQQTLRATLDWSYELLSEAERRALNALAVFAGGFTLEAAVSIINQTGETASAVAQNVASLVEKSLVTKYDIGNVIRAGKTLREW